MMMIMYVRRNMILLDLLQSSGLYFEKLKGFPCVIDTSLFLAVLNLSNENVPHETLA